MSNKPAATKTSDAEETFQPAPLFDDETGYCIAEGNVRIENNTDHLINLVAIPNAPDFPKGIKLWPGLTTVPNKYWVALQHLEPGSHLRCHSDPDQQKFYKPSKLRPGQAAIDTLLKHVWITTANGRHKGPQITVYQPEQVSDRDDGPRFPQTLSEYSDVTALELIKHVSNKETLQLWLESEFEARRANIRQAIVTRLASL